MAAYTPGPWEVAGNCVRTQYRMGDPESHGTMVADVGVYLPEREANARLIAAAPELLEAAARVIKAKADHQVWSGAGVARALLPYTEADLRRESEDAFGALAAALAKAAPSTSDGEGDEPETPRDTTPPDLKAVLGDALRRASDGEG